MTRLFSRILNLFLHSNIIQQLDLPLTRLFPYLVLGRHLKGPGVEIKRFNLSPEQNLSNCILNKSGKYGAEEFISTVLTTFDLINIIKDGQSLHEKHIYYFRASSFKRCFFLVQEGLIFVINQPPDLEQ